MYEINGMAASLFLFLQRINKYCLTLIPEIMTRSRFEVIYEAGSRCTTYLMLYGGTESEAKEELYRRGSVARDREIIILSIRPC